MMTRYLVLTESLALVPAELFHHLALAPVLVLSQYLALALVPVRY